MSASPLSDSSHTLAALCGAGTRAAAAAVGRLIAARSTAVEAPELLSRAALTELLGSGPKMAAAFEVSGGLEGALWLVLDVAAARCLADSVLGGAGKGESLDERALAALSEIGNIGASAFLNAVADRINVACLPSVPRLLFGDALEISGSLASGLGEDLLVSRAHLGAGEAIALRLVMAPTAAAARSLRASS
jgi:chemotaxis protein CheY-P-specific phosphatase CheC